MRRVLGVLRQEDGQPDPTPQPGLDRLEDLAENAGAVGLTVTMAVTGTQRTVPPSVGVSVYRIVQESLSNVMRHAPGSAVHIEIAYRDQPPAVRVRVENDVPSSRPSPDARDGARHGLVGIRERAAMLHGELVAGPTATGGFTVVATLPLEHE